MREKLSMIRAILYGTLGCHLCDDAEVLMAPLLVEISEQLGLDCEIECIDISEDDLLLERYGERIPVLRWSAAGGADSDVELDWPFDVDQVKALLLR